MPLLSQLLTNHGSLLVLDAASTNVQVGLLRSDAPALWQNNPGEAGAGIFTGTAAVLQEARLKIDAVDAFVFCEGPGSMLGIRTVTMALRTWQVLVPRPAYAYQSLTVAAHFEWSRKDSRDFAVIADARRDAWHCQPVDAGGRMPPLQRRPAAGLPAGELVTPENFRAWAQPPRPAGLCSYDLARIFPAMATVDCFRPVEAPDAFQHEAPAYRKWSAQIHRAAVAAPRA
jgi:tRNA threonylcarbamoyladenosine biosynthesis protein TsaB